ncbi:MAG: alpha/beta hydrolase [Hyphomicrobiales bacterium]|nr:MAG: alpha/beta hydrolase [Hyphomicrobiales bacterium]
MKTVNSIREDDDPTLSSNDRGSLEEWFNEGISCAPERLSVSVEGVEIETLVWGKEGAPGVLLVHGLNAHADWWSHIGPHLAEGFRVAAVTLSFAGAWRERYSYEGFANELWECAQAASLYDSGRPPAYVGHSFGGNQVVYTARRYPERLSSGILVDCGIVLPPPTYPMPKAYAESEALMSRDRRYRVYDTVEEAIAHYRFEPPQPCDHRFIVEHVARKSLRGVPTNSGQAGWTWRYDPQISSKWDLSRTASISETHPPPMAHVWGERSARTAPFCHAPSMLDLKRVGIPLAHHHVMLDQPVALIAALRHRNKLAARARRRPARAGRPTQMIIAGLRRRS